MATVSALALRRTLGGLALLASLASGCVHVTMPSLTWVSHQPQAVVPRVSNVVLAWQNSIGLGPDALNGGQPVPILAGRMHLFGTKMDYPVVAEGGLRVEVFDESTGVVTPAPIFTWDVDAKDMPKLMRRDVVGVGYTVLLPWPSYQPTITRVRVRTAYLQPGTLPVYTENQLTLDVGNGQMHDGTKYIQPASFQSPKHVEIPRN